MQLSRITQSFSRRAWSPVAQLARSTSQVTRQRSKAVAAVLLAGTALAGGAVALAAGNAKLTIADGVVVKFGEGAGINVRDQLQTGSNVIFTSQFDDTALGATNPQAEAPEAGDWLGVLVAKDVPTTGLKIDGLTIRYAGGTTGLPSYMNGGAGLVLNGGAYGFNRLQFSGNTVGIRVIGTGSPSIAKSRLVQNGVGLLAEQGATPVISESDISANTQFGVRNTVILTAFAAETGDTPRGTFTINYKLVQARPDLFAKPTFIETGVQQESTVTESVVIGNRGLVAAQNVQVKLVDSNGNPPPAWMFLASGNQIGAIDVGGEVPIQVTASPGKTVADGIYNFKLIVTAANSGDGTIPVSVAVTQSGQGGVSFHVTDLFTETLGADNKPIKGVAGARIRLQNDAVLTYIRTLTTDAEGKAVVTDLPPGTYTYRASGPRHSDKSGRIFVRPGITASERIHLQYQTISIDFSVTETTIQDVYNINLEATFQTQVPAPVVLLEPLSINLPELQIGEEFTGELTLTNYGLIKAEEVAFKPPQSDEYYKYEFLADIPKVLAAKQRIVIPYRVTAIKLHPKGIGFTKAKAGDFTEVQRALAKTFSTKAASCSSYSVWATAECSFECVNGERENRVVFSQYSRLVGTGTSCTSGGSSGPPIYYGPRLPGGDGGGWGGSGSGSGTPLPLAPECTPHCRGECCAKGGSSTTLAKPSTR